MYSNIQQQLWYIYPATPRLTDSPGLESLAHPSMCQCRMCCSHTAGGMGSVFPWGHMSPGNRRAN